VNLPVLPIGLLLQFMGMLSPFTIRAGDRPARLHQKRDRVLTHLDQVFADRFQFLYKVFAHRVSPVLKLNCDL